MGAALHFDLWVPNFGIQEYMRHNDETDAVFPHAYVFDNGFLHPGEAPGHGVDIDEALAAKYPYEAAYLPVARLEDGTMWSRSEAHTSELQSLMRTSYAVFRLKQQTNNKQK